jgi:hypothetical protein
MADILDEASSKEASANPSGPILFFRGMRGFKIFKRLHSFN